jgi:hypothetical protein
MPITTKVKTRQAGFPFHIQKNTCSLGTSVDLFEGKYVALYLHHISTGETCLVINGGGQALPAHLEKPLIDFVLSLHQDCLKGVLVPFNGKVVTRYIREGDLSQWKIPPAEVTPYRELRIIG